jgi:uncharacterized integral membrane protein
VNDVGPAKPAPQRAGHTVRTVVGVLVILVLVAVVVDNRRDTRIGYVFGDVRAPLFVFLILAAIVGAAIGWLILHRPRRDHERSRVE